MHVYVSTQAPESTQPVTREPPVSQRFRSTEGLFEFPILEP